MKQAHSGLVIYDRSSRMDVADRITILYKVLHLEP
jgi:hypothetical protein